MQDILLLSSLDPNFKLVTVVFDGATNEYTYKTVLPVNVGDYCVVKTSTGVKVVKVISVLALEDLATPPTVKLKWIAQVISFAHYEAMLDADKSIETQLRKAEINNSRERLLDSLGVQRL